MDETIIAASNFSDEFIFDVKEDGLYCLPDADATILQLLPGMNKFPVYKATENKHCCCNQTPLTQLVL